MKLLSNMAVFFSGLKRRLFFSGRSESVYFGSLRENEIVGAIANAVASNVAKLTPQVIRKTSAGTTIKNDKIGRAHV